MFFEIVVLKTIVTENTYDGVSFNKAVYLKTCNFIKKTPVQVFSCEYCEI